MRLVVLALTAALLPLTAWAGQDVTYTVDGAKYEGYSAKASGQSKGLVVIVHDWDGLTSYEKKRADMLAALGYDAFAVDLFGKGNRPQSVQGNKRETGRLYKDRARMRSLMLGGLAAARRMGDTKTVVIGYCFGGAAVLEMARSGQAKDVAGYATFHGGLATPPGESYPKNTPPILIEHGGADTSVPPAQAFELAKELEAAGITYQVDLYSGAPHAFTVFGGSRYRKHADELSWQRFQEFLKAQTAS